MLGLGSLTGSGKFPFAGQILALEYAIPSLFSSRTEKPEKCKTRLRKPTF
jgi:hypothetical protein